MSEGTKGRDDGFMEADGSLRPIREVIRERRQLAGKYSKAMREESFRRRAGMQAQLIICECCYPLVKLDTPSGHELWCPGHGYHLSSERAADRVQHADPTLDPAMVDIEYTLAKCPRCGANVPDHDGFGVLAHIKPAHADGCGYCSHPSRDLVPGKGWICGICELVVESDSVAPPIATSPSVEYPSAHELVVDDPDDPTAAATSGDREKIARAFLAAPVNSPQGELLLNALATKDVRRDGGK